MTSYDLQSSSEIHNALDYTDIHVKDEIVYGHWFDVNLYQACEIILVATRLEATTNTVTWTWSLEDSDDFSGTNSAPVSSDFIIGTPPVITLPSQTVISNQIYSMGYVGGKRTVRPKCVVTTTTVADAGTSHFLGTAMISFSSGGVLVS